ncbi:hypothetical protein K2P96_02920 [Patescibacteria group bacterium]|nr:hypothetical protein [Patescibacteria group bacterium]
MKNNLPILFGVFVVILGFYFFNQKEVKAPVVSNEPIDMCYFYSKTQASGLSDVAWVKMHITGPNVTGEFQDIPAEKDKKVGTFTGTVGTLNQLSMSRTADVIWNTMAEGMTAKEELNIEFGDGSAVALYGEMVDGGDGVYMYKDKTHLTPGPVLSQMDCVELDKNISK